MPQEQDPDDSIQTLMDVIAALEISPGAQAHLNVCLESLTDRSSHSSNLSSHSYCNTSSTIGLNICKLELIYMQ